MNSPAEFPACLHVALDVSFSKGRISGVAAPEVWRAAIKDQLLIHAPPAQAERLLAPLSQQQAGGNIDCPGFMVSSRETDRGARVMLKFLGDAWRDSVLCFLALQTALSYGVGRQLVTGGVTGLSVFDGQLWQPIAIPLKAEEMRGWCRSPQVLSGLPFWNDDVKAPVATQWVLRTLSRWFWTSKGRLVRRVPDWADVLNLVEQRLWRAGEAWGGESWATVAVDWRSKLEECRSTAGGSRRIDSSWSIQRRVVGEKRYPSHGFSGWVLYEGELTEDVWELLRIASFLHVGQQTSIGLGSFTLERCKGG